MPDIVSVMATGDDDGHRCFAGDFRTFCGLDVAAGIPVRRRRQAHRESPCPDCYDPGIVAAAARARTAPVGARVPFPPPPLPRPKPRPRPRPKPPPVSAPDHPLRSVWDLCERLDQAHAAAVRPRPQEAP